MATIKPDPAYPDRWLVSDSKEAGSKIGAYLSDDPSPELAVYWSGKVGRDSLFEIMREAGTILDKKGSLTGKFFAYGENLREEIPLSEKDILLKSSAKSPRFPKFDACRAELSGPDGAVTVWANVTGPVAGLDEGTENIGVSMSPWLFEAAVRPVISRAIARTMDLSGDAVTELLDEVSHAVLRSTPQVRY